MLDPRGFAAPAWEARKRAAFAAADVALAASGTVSLELAAAGTPMVIAYDANALTVWMVRRLIRIDTATLVNLVTDTRAVPEFLFERLHRARRSRRRWRRCSPTRAPPRRSARPATGRWRCSAAAASRRGCGRPARCSRIG